MFLGDRLRLIRLQRGFSQRQLGERAGLPKVRIAAIETGRVVPSIPTLERIAVALSVPLYLLFYGVEQLPHRPSRLSRENLVWWGPTKESRLLLRFRILLGRMSERDRQLLLFLARELARH